MFRLPSLARCAKFASTTTFAPRNTTTTRLLAIPPHLHRSFSSNNSNSSSNSQQQGTADSGPSSDQRSEQGESNFRRKILNRRLFLFTGACLAAAVMYYGKSTVKRYEDLYDATMFSEPPRMDPVALPDDPLFKEIAKLMEERMFHKAVILASELLEVNPNDYLAKYLRGKALGSMSKFEEAQRELDQVVHMIRPNRDKIKGFAALYKDVLHSLELALFAQQKYMEALTVNHYLVAEYPWNLEYVSERADLYANTRQYQDAVRWSEKLLQLHKEKPEIFERNLKASYSTGELSVPLFLSEVYRIKGISLFKQQDLENALACFEEAIRLSPKKNLFYASKAEILQQQGHFEAAYNALAAAPGADTHRYFVFQRLELLAQQAKFEEALELHNKLLKQDENTPPAVLIDILMTKAKLQMGAKRFDELLETADQMSKFYTTESLRLKAMAYGGKGNFEEAKKYIDKAIATQPTDHRLYQIRDSIVQEMKK